MVRKIAILDMFVHIFHFKEWQNKEIRVNFCFYIGKEREQEIIHVKSHNANVLRMVSIEKTAQECDKTAV